MLSCLLSWQALRETAEKRTETLVERTETLVDTLAPNLNPALTVTEPTAYTSGLDTVQYYALVDVVPACNAQLGGLSSTMMHGAGGMPITPKSLTQIAAGPNT